MSDPVFAETVPVGIIQTTTNSDFAWPKDGQSPAMSDAEDAHAWHEITKAMRELQDSSVKPKIVVLPELALPRTRVDAFDRLVASLNVIAITGVDYRTDEAKLTARNEGFVFVPKQFFRSHPGRYCTRILFGKSYAAPGEKRKLRGLAKRWEFEGDHKVYVFDCAKYGRLGVSICYDFMDIERALMYRGQIHHLLVLAYNRDLEMFRSLATSLSRTVFCNVVVCNTGHYGGSLCIAPYYQAFRRVVYGHSGESLFTTQVVQLPVRELEIAKRNPDSRGKGKDGEPIFKDPPPGTVPSDELSERQLKIQYLTSVPTLSGEGGRE